MLEAKAPRKSWGPSLKLIPGHYPPKDRGRTQAPVEKDASSREDRSRSPPKEKDEALPTEVTDLAYMLSQEGLTIQDFQLQGLCQSVLLPAVVRRGIFRIFFDRLEAFLNFLWRDGCPFCSQFLEAE